MRRRRYKFKKHFLFSRNNIFTGDMQYLDRDLRIVRKGIRYHFGHFTQRELKRFFQRILAATSRLTNVYLLFLYHYENMLAIGVFRFYLLPTLRRTRKWVRLGHIFVNTKQIFFPGYYLRPGDLVSMSHFLKAKNRFYHRFIKMIRLATKSAFIKFLPPNYEYSGIRRALLLIIIQE